MKRILAVLALLALCGMAFSVTGKIYTRMGPTGGALNRANDWNFDGPVKDTGFDLNFDGFGFTYKLMGSEASAGGTILSNAQAAAPSLLANSATTPGWFELNGINLGPLQGFEIGGAVWFAERSGSTFITNPAGTTNTNGTASYSFNKIVLNTSFSIPVSDTLSVAVDGWDRWYFIMRMASGKTEMAGALMTATNSYTGSSYVFHAPVYISYNMDALSLQIKPGIEISGATESDNSLTKTNALAMSKSIISALARLTYKISDTYSVYAHAGVEVMNKSTMSNSLLYTNTVTETSTKLPIKGGIQIRPAPGITFNVGLGYMLMLSATSKQEDSAGVTNTTTTGSGIYNSYGELMNDNYYGGKPFISVGGSAKMDDNWEVGWGWVNLWDASGWGQNTDVYTDSTDKLGFTKQSSLFMFGPEINYDENVYIQYTKNNVTLRGVFGNATGVFGAFSRFDIIYSF